MQTNCVLCAMTDDKAIWSNDKLRVIAVDDEAFPGYIRVIWKAHVPEMTDLSDTDRELLYKVLLIVELTLRNTMQPDKINLAQFGNMVPHLHWHIIARYRDDSHFPESIWGTKQRDNNPETLQMRRKLALMMKTQLRQAFENSNL